MAQDKKSFILYADLLHTVNKLPDNKAGKLFKHILDYVNDKDPKTDDIIIQISFEPIKQQLKRDLEKWTNNRLKRSEAGRLGGLARASNVKQNQAMLESAKQNQANQAVTVNVNDNVTVNDIKNRKLKFSQNINKFTDHSKKTLSDFLDYWSEPNKSNTKMRFELERTWDLNLRLKRWNKNEFNKSTKDDNPKYDLI